MSDFARLMDCIFTEHLNQRPRTRAQTKREEFLRLKITIVSYFTPLIYLYLAPTDMGCDAANVASDE